MFQKQNQTAGKYAIMIQLVHVTNLSIPMGCVESLQGS